MSNKYEDFIAANTAYLNLMQQQQRVSERVQTLSSDSAVLLSKLHAAASETRRTIELHIRGVARDADVSAAKGLEAELRNQFAEIQEEIDVARTTGSNMVSEVAQASNETRSTLDAFCRDIVDTLTKPINGDAKLRQRLLEIHAARFHHSEALCYIIADVQWGEMLAEVFATPTAEEHRVALESFKTKHRIPSPGQAEFRESVSA